MKKILLSVLTIALTVGVVSSSAYALFSDKVSVQGVTLASGNADLHIVGTNDSSGVLVYNQTFDGLYPSEQRGPLTFQLENKSDSKIGLVVTAKIPDGGATGNWNELKDKLFIYVNSANGYGNTGYVSLNTLNSSGITLPGVIPHTGINTYQVYLKVIDSAGNEIADKELSNIQIDLVGTQQ